MSAINHDDPRLTAYALGELPADECAAIQQYLAHHPELRAEVDQIRSLSGDLARDFATDLAQTPALTRPQRVTIARAVKPRAWRVVGWSVLTTAAAAAIALAVLPDLRQPDAPLPVRLTMTTAAPSQPQVDAAPTTARAEIVVPPFQPSDQQEEEDLVLASGPHVQAYEKRLPMTSPPQPGSPPTIGQGATVAETGSTGAFMAIGKASAGTSATRRAEIAPTETADAAVDAKVGASGEAEARKSPVTALDSLAQGDGAVASAAASAPQSTTYPSVRVGAERSSPAADAAKRVGPPAAPLMGGFRLHESATQPLVPPVTDGGETYNQRADHSFRSAVESPLSTFGLDVDTASYGNIRRMIEGGALPPRDAVRVEELVNYFPYEDVPPPVDGEAFGVLVEVAPCPWEPAHKLARIVIRGRGVDARPALNLVFLVDVSGSMKPDNRLPLVKTGLSLLANTLREQDKVTIVTYAGSANVALPTTAGNDQRTILKAVDRLTADGGTNGGSGIQLAYDAARAGFARGGVNRVILCTDGDFNVGVTNRDDLVRLVQTRAAEGVFLTVLGVGQDNLKDATMELLADKANGHYHYLDTIAEARKVLVEQMSATMVTIAKDAKAQIEFNPARIAAWRQLGYEKRQLSTQDFADDRKDAGEVGADHQVTMLYELVPTGLAAGHAGDEDGLRYQPERRPAAPVIAERHNELLSVKLRYKEPTGSVSRLVQGVVTDEQVRQAPSVDQRFAGMVAAFALRLRGSEAMNLEFAAIASEARRALGRDPQGYRREFLQLVERAAALKGASLRE